MPAEYSITEILRFAVEIEKEGEIFYDKMADKTASDSLKKLYLKLKADESSHKKTFENLLDNTGPDKNEYAYHLENEYIAYLHSIIENTVFHQKDIDKLSGSLNDDLSVLNYAIDRENDSINYYNNLKNIIPDKHISIIDEVIDEEKNHARNLTDAKKNLK